MEPDGWVLEALRESSVPGALLMLIRIDAGLGAERVCALDRVNLAVGHNRTNLFDRLLVETEWNATSRVVRLKRWIHPHRRSHLLIERKAALYWMHLRSLNLNAVRVNLRLAIHRYRELTWNTTDCQAVGRVHFDDWLLHDLGGSLILKEIWHTLAELLELERSRIRI